MNEMRLLTMALVLAGGVTGVQALAAEETKDCDTCPPMVELSDGQSMSATPVTVAEFRAFSEATGFEPSGKCFLKQNKGWKNTEGATWLEPGFEQGDDHPVVCVTWLDATAYADWLTETTGAFYRLPTLEEMMAATSIAEGQQFWWGDDFGQVCDYANAADAQYRGAFPDDPRNILQCDDGYPYTSPVRAYPANALGLHDMAGNVWQWTNSCKEGDCSNAIFRGAAWTVPNPKFFLVDGHFADRILLSNNSVGFRVMREAE